MTARRVQAAMKGGGMTDRRVRQSEPKMGVNWIGRTCYERFGDMPSTDDERSGKDRRVASYRRMIEMVDSHRDCDTDDQDFCDLIAAIRREPRYVCCCGECKLEPERDSADPIHDEYVAAAVVLADTAVKFFDNPVRGLWAGSRDNIERYRTAKAARKGKP